MPFSAEGKCGKPPYSVASEPLIDEATSEAAFICAVICAVLGTIGNILAGAVLLGNGGIRGHPTTPFLASLAASDLILSAFNLPLLAVRFYNRDWVLGYTTCRLFPFFFYGNIFVSVFSMTFVAVNRFAGIFYPHLVPEIFSLRRSWVMVAFIWMFSFGLLVPPLAGWWGQMGYEPATFSCTILPLHGKDPTVFLVITGAITPCLVTVACYVLLLLRVKRTGREVRRAVASDEVHRLAGKRSVSRMTKARERQLTTTLALICVGFLVCFLPSGLLAVIDPMPPCYEHPRWHIATAVVFWCSAFINPVVYVVCNRTYRAALGDLLRKILRLPETTQPSSIWYEDDHEISSPLETALTAKSSKKSNISSSSRRQERRRRLREHEMEMRLHDDDVQENGLTTEVPIDL